MDEPRFGVAINYFSRPDHPRSVRHSAELTVSLLAACPEVTTRVLVDASEIPDEVLRATCEAHATLYHHAGRKLGFGEAYNLGVSMLPEPWVVTMAADVYVFRSTFENFANFIKARPGLPIGCLVPYLSYSDFPPQMHAGHRGCRSGSTPLMTINLNVFPREVFAAIGGVPVYLSGAYNDVEMCLALRARGLEVYLVDAFVQHYGKMTLSHGSDFASKADAKAFFEDHPEFRQAGAMWGVDIEKLMLHTVPRLGYFVGRRFGILRLRAVSFKLEMLLRRLPPVPARSKPVA